MAVQSPLNSSDMNKIALLLKLAEPLLLKGSNLYSSPDLAKLLKSQKTHYAGILKLNRKNVPSKVKEQKLKTGELIVQHVGPVSVIKWSDTRTLAMVSSFCSYEMTRQQEVRSTSTKCTVFIEYNKFMGEVLIRKVSCYGHTS
jgi:hypothetical protein